MWPTFVRAAEVPLRAEGGAQGLAPLRPYLSGGGMGVRLR